MKSPPRLLSATTLLPLAFLLAACSGIKAAPPEARSPRDPWEPYNRAMYSFNRGLDRAILRPVARGYDWLTPAPVQRSIGNAFTNLHYPVVVLNLALQGRPKDGGLALGRFVVNSTAGVAGFFDVATRLDMPTFDEDFGQTLAVWGWRDSRYFMLPLLGPSTRREGPARAVAWKTDLANNWVVDQAGYGPLALEVVDTRAGYLDQEHALEEAYDEYVFVRDAWMQNRDFLISNGQTVVPDYDSFIDEGQ
ncbi:MAG: VacJ family lipoprotein [Gammaproteobacteria bacterium]|nr:VacJ family lipoprotein [Gammaproteobacteria bacterium]